MRGVAPLLLAFGTVIMLVGLVCHFAGHPDQLARPWLIFTRVGMVPIVLSQLSKHPTTVLSIVGVLFFSVGVIFTTVAVAATQKASSSRMTRSIASTSAEP